MFGQIAREQRIVRGGVPVDAAGAEAKNAEAGARAVGFREVTVVLKAEMLRADLGREIGNAAPDAVGSIAEFGLEAKRFADGRMNAVAGDNEIRFSRSPIFKVK